MRYTYFRVAALLFGGLLCVTSEAQNQSGHATGDQAKELLHQRIKDQSEGRITLFGFRTIATRTLDLELAGKLTSSVEFEAGIEFDAPCRWASRYQGRPMTFVVLKPEADYRAADARHVLEIKKKGERFVMRGAALFTHETNGWILAGFEQSSDPVHESVVLDESSAQCICQLKQIGLAFRMWAVDNSDRYPFNVSTNSGGTMELCARGGDGFDAGATFHFQVMSNELSTPKILVCPADSSRQPAVDFGKIQAVNVTYLMLSGTNKDETNPQEILARCPIHGHVCLCDGTVKRGTEK